MIKLEIIGCDDFFTTIIGLSLDLIISLFDRFAKLNENWNRTILDILNGKICCVGPPTGPCLRSH